MVEFTSYIISGFGIDIPDLGAIHFYQFCFNSRQQPVNHVSANVLDWIGQVWKGNLIETAQSLIEPPENLVYLPLLFSDFPVPPVSAVITPTEGGSLQSQNGKVGVVFPPGAVDQPITLTYTQQAGSDHSHGNLLLANIGFELEAADSLGNPVTAFNQPYDLTIQYADSDWQQAGISDEFSLNLYWWNGSQWVGSLPCAGCSLDTQNNQIVVLLDHLTEFALLGQAGAADTPTPNTTPTTTNTSTPSPTGTTTPTLTKTPTFTNTPTPTNTATATPTPTETITPTPDFSIGVTPLHNNVLQGEVVTYTVSLTATYGFNTPVSLSVDGLPLGVTTNWSANPILPSGESTLSITTSLTAPAGVYTMTVTGMGGGQIHASSALLHIEPVTLPIVDHCGTITSNETWKTGVVHRVTCTVGVNQGATLTLDSGTIVKFMNPASIDVSGDLLATGVVGDPIFLTSYKDDSVGGDTNGDSNATSPAPGDWLGIRQELNSSASFDHVVISYGGNNHASAGNIYAQASSLQTPLNITLTIDHSTISNGLTSGIYLSGSNALLSVTNSTIGSNQGGGIVYNLSDGSPVFRNLVIQDNGNIGISAGFLTTAVLTGNTFTGNEGYAAWLSFSNGTFTENSDNTGSNNLHNSIVLSGSLDGDSILTNNPTLPYSVDATLYVFAGHSLTIQPGTVFKMNANNIGGIEVEGTLTALGTATQPIVFTSFKDDFMVVTRTEMGQPAVPLRGIGMASI